MKRRVKAVVSCSRGAGSVLDLAPRTDCARLVPRESFNDRLEANFRRVGDTLRKAVDTIREETSLDESSKTRSNANQEHAGKTGC